MAHSTFDLELLDLFLECRIPWVDWGAIAQLPSTKSIKNYYCFLELPPSTEMCGQRKDAQDPPKRKNAKKKKKTPKPTLTPFKQFTQTLKDISEANFMLRMQSEQRSKILKLIRITIAISTDSRIENGQGWNFNGVFARILNDMKTKRPMNPRVALWIICGLIKSFGVNKLSNNQVTSLKFLFSKEDGSYSDKSDKVIIL
jgi:hypothetical protein